MERYRQYFLVWIPYFSKLIILWIANFQWMCLSVPHLEVLHEVSTGRLRAITIWVRLRRFSKCFPVADTPSKTIGCVNRVTCLVPQDFHAPGFGATLNFKQLLSLQTHQSWVSQIEGNRDPWNTIWWEPFVTQPTMRWELESAMCQFVVKLLDPIFQRSSADCELQITDPRIEQLLIRHRVQIWLFRRHVAIEKLKTWELQPKRSRQFIQQTTNVFIQKPRTG